MKRWYHLPNTTWRRAFAMSAIPMVLFGTLYLSPWGEALENRVSRPFQFRVRHWLGKDPVTDPRIKMYVFGNPEFGYFRRELTLVDWAKLLKSLAPSSPAGVYIDKVFAKPLTASEARDAKVLEETIRNLKFPVVVGSFMTSVELPDRQRLSLNSADYRLGDSSYPIDGGNAYGPPEELVAAFSHVGHVMYAGDLTAKAFFRLSDKVYVPSSAFFASKTREFRDGKLWLDSGRVPTTRDGRVLVNMAAPEAYLSKTFSMKNMLLHAEKNEPAQNIPKDGWILFHTDFYTGGPDQHMTPFGILPGLYVMNALFNSTLTGNWIVLDRFGIIFLVFAGFLGTLLGVRLLAAQFWIGLFSLEVLISVLGLALFSYFRFETSWFFSMATLLSTAAVSFIDKTRSIEGKARRLREALEDAIPNDHLEEILEAPQTLDLSPRSRVITIMFIDIVGFSVVAEKLSPEEAFRYLKETMTRLGHTVNSFGGVVEKTMGDGMLCLFGFHYDNRPESQYHASEALRCAIALQRDNVQNNLDCFAKKKPLFPIRIGINTSAAYIGDLGSTLRIDLTVIGHGVNYAKRLEAACDPNCIIMGRTTRDLLANTSPHYLEGIERRYVQIKHHTELMEAYEMDPFFKDPQVRNEATKAYREFAGWNRTDVRLPVTEVERIRVTTNHGAGRLVNFSRDGVGVELDQYLAVGVVLQISLDAESAGWNQRLASMGLLPLTAEVRWGRIQSKGKYVHGLLIKNLNEIQRQKLVSELTQLNQALSAA